MLPDCAPGLKLSSGDRASIRQSALVTSATRKVAPEGDLTICQFALIAICTVIQRKYDPPETASSLLPA